MDPADAVRLLIWIGVLADCCFIHLAFTSHVKNSRSAAALANVNALGMLQHFGRAQAVFLNLGRSDSCKCDAIHSCFASCDGIKLPVDQMLI